jgi:hypothetical protein
LVQAGGGDIGGGVLTAAERSFITVPMEIR